jgi:hypothetical protein
MRVNRTIPRLATLAVVVLASALMQTTDPAILVVDDDGGAPYTSIQSAIDAAVPGEDEVFVECGTYYENIVMRDGVSVRGQGAQCATIDPVDQDLPTVDMPSLGEETVFEGFTVMSHHRRYPAIPGIRVSTGYPVITRNVIEGGGPTVYSNTGIGVTGGAPVISYNVIRGNYDCCWGGGVLLDGTDARVVSNLIVGNYAYYGAGIEIQFGQPQVLNNTIVDNTGWLGGGIHTYGDGVVANNVIVGNTAEIYGGGVTDWGTETLFAYNNVWGNEPDNYSTEDLTGTNGNISVDPQFIDGTLEFTGSLPRSSSPLVDAASPILDCDKDLRGIVRPVDGDADSLARCDIGARENVGVTGLVHTAIEFVWDPGLHMPHDFNIYRGDLETLKETGVYTQDPAVVNGARHFCDYANYLGDTDTPDVGRVWFYLPVAWGMVEGTLGFDSSPVERPKHMYCQGP